MGEMAVDLLRLNGGGIILHRLPGPQHPDVATASGITLRRRLARRHLVVMSSGSAPFLGRHHPAADGIRANHNRLLQREAGQMMPLQLLQRDEGMTIV